MIITMKEHAIINRHYSGATAEHKQATVQLARIKLAISSRTKKTK